MSDIVAWIMENGTVLDGTVIAHIFVICMVIEFFGMCTYCFKRF